MKVTNHECKYLLKNHDYNSNHDGWVNFSEFLREIEDAYDIEKALKNLKKQPKIGIIPITIINSSYNFGIIREI